VKLLCALLLLVCVIPQSIAAGPVSDDELHDKVRIRLAGDREVGGEKIEVQVDNGVVTLSGIVQSSKARSRAEKLTKKVKGVHKVVNELKVSPT
jgi:osmotically-inducible protein OsmY